MTNAPTTRETADHAELARLAAAATPGEWRVAEDNNPFADGRHVFAKGLDGTDFVVLNLKTDHTFVTATSREQQQRNALFAAAANPATVLALLSEIAALRGERTGDDYAAQAEVDEHAGKALDWEIIAGSWKDRATQAERQRDEAVGLLREWMGTWFVDSDSRGEKVIADDTRKYLLANQGADQ